MEEARSKYEAGDLTGAIQLALEAVKAKPTDLTARIFLFELSCFSGDWERAGKQLDVIGKQDMNAMIGTTYYKQNLAAENDRIATFGEGMVPECLLPPPKYVEDLLVASNHIREGRTAEARQVLDGSDEARPAFPCKVNGNEYSDFRDFNDLTSCVFEVIVTDSYTWIPFEQVEKIVFFEPKSLRDLFWIHCEVEMVNGTKGEMFLPSIYVNSHKSDDDLIRLGRASDWKDAGDDILIGEGSRVFAVGSDHIPMSQIRELEFMHVEDSDESE